MRSDPRPSGTRTSRPAPLRPRRTARATRWVPFVAVLMLQGMARPPQTPAADLPAPAATAARDDDRSAATNPHVWRPKTQTVAVFKNGLGFFTRRGTARLSDGWCYAAEIPPAAFGTLAVYAHSPRQTVDVVGSGPGQVVMFDDHDAPSDVESKRGRLQALAGLKVELQYQHRGTSRSAAGTLASVGPQYAVLETSAQTVAVALRDVQQLQVLDLPLRVHVDDTATADGGAAATSAGQANETHEADLGIAYLRKEITWIPEYTLQILDDQTAELTLRGTLVNEAEDLVHCDVNFVVGVPHFVHSESLSPVAVGRVIRTLAAANATDGVPAQVMTQMMNRAVIANSYTSPQIEGSAGATTQPAPAAGGDLDSVISSLPSLESAAAGDFTVYTKADMTVRRGERAIVTLFKQKIRYRHLYRWETPHPVQHFLTLENATATAWTTGPCLALSDGNPLSEDLLKYTPRGGKGELQVTTAINIAHSKTEQEADRQLKAHEPRYNEFLDRVVVAGEIRLKSFETRPVEVLVQHAVDGRPIEADHEGVIQVDASRLRLLERAGNITWRFTLQPGQERLLTYRYERYVPSN